MRSGFRTALFFLAATIPHSSLPWAEETVGRPRRSICARRPKIVGSTQKAS